MTRLFLFIIILPFLLLCCQRNSITADDLKEIEQLLQSSPDLSYVQILQYPTERLQTSGDSALYRLILAEARYKTFNADTIDNALESAVDYFILHKDNNRAIRTLYCKGELHLASAQIGKGLVAATDALELVDTTCDFFQAGRLHYLISELYHSLWDGPQQLSHAYKALYYYNKEDTLEFVTDAKLWYAISLSQMGKCKEGTDILSQLLSDATYMGDTTLMIQTLGHLGNSYLWNKDYSQALKHYSQLRELTGNSMELRELRLMLWSMIEVGAYPDSIESIANIITDNFGKNNLIEEYYTHIDKYAEAYFKLKNETKEAGEHTLKLLRDTSNEYLEINQQEKMKIASIKISSLKLQNLLSIIIGVFILLILIVAGVFLLHRKNYMINKLLGRVNRTLAVAKNFRQQYNDIKLERDNLKKENNNLLEENKGILTLQENDYDKATLISSDKVINLFHSVFEVLNSHYSAYYTTSDISGKGILLKEMKDKLNILREDDIVLSEMEHIINKESDNLLEDVFSSIRKINETQRRLTCFLYIGWSIDCICAIFNLTPDQFYNRKSRLISKLMQSASPKKTILIERLSKSKYKS